MLTVKELLALSPREVYGKAVNAGIEVAVMESANKDRHALAKWFRDHPEFADPKVNQQMMRGCKEAQIEVLTRVAHHPNIYVVNLG